MRISGTADTGWIPVDLTQVALAITAVRTRSVPRRAAAPARPAPEAYPAEPVRPAGDDAS